ncbi:DUF3626 domain-containing protein [Haliangium ochraceum]|uniref:DUF3626 domain-containing protein n=1 Tax=Haliangium ochraceum TaxID=80816 RepID=UPI0018EF8781|nr:DUF3626 domain-containing protein [Haliangium ochraceum]
MSKRSKFENAGPRQDKGPATGHQPRASTPGKVSRTGKLASPPVQAKAASRAAPPVPPAAPGVDPAVQERSSLTARWLNTAMRPDLHAPPAQRKSAGPETEAAAPSAPQSSSGRAMPRAVQAKMEHAFDTDFSAVRIHEGSQATSLGAHAFAQGSDIHFAPGQYDPGSQRGQELLGHELAHVVQQSEGRVNATRQAHGAAINDEPALEAEADVMGARAARGERVRAGAGPGSASATRPSVQRRASGGAPVQRKGPRETAQERGVHLDERPILGQDAPALVMNPSANAGRSMAEDPHFEQEAAAFEQALGKYAFNDPRANEAAGALVAKINPYLEARSQALALSLQEQAATLKKLAGERTFAGTVTQFDQQAEIEDNIRSTQQAIDAIIAGGNLRERLNLLDQFMKVVGEDFHNANDVEKWQRFRGMAGAAELDTDALDARDQSAAPGRARSMLDHGSETTQLPERDRIRVPSNLPDQRTEQSLNDMRHTPLSPAEAQFQDVPTFGQEQVDTTRWDQRGKRLGFTEGGRTFLVNESHQWVQQMRALSLPLRAGPSGHTQVFFEANTLLGAGVDPYAVRLAAIGHLLPIRAHSLIEILVVAAAHGCVYEENQNLYKSLQPFSQSELRRIGGGSFPGESELDATRNREAERVMQEPEHDEQLAIEDRQMAARAQYADDIGWDPDTQEGPVTSFLANAPQREGLETALQSPLKSWNQRESLATSDAYAAETEEEDRVAAQQRIIELIIELGADPADFPHAFDQCVEHIQRSPLTVNFFTAAAPNILQGGYLNRAERSFGTPDSNQAFNPNYGNPQYASDRDQVEQTMHDMPPMHPHFVPEDMQVARISDDRTGRLYAPTARSDRYPGRGPMITVTDPQGHTRPWTGAQASRPPSEFFRGRELLSPPPAEQLPRDGRTSQPRYSLPSDRPHSAAVNAVGYRAGGAPSANYGKSHLVFKEEVKQRSTYTGQDSKDFIFQGTGLGGPANARGASAVATYGHLARAIRFADPGALKVMIYEALKLADRGIAKPETTGAGGAFLPYIEAQILGEIDLSRDVSKLVIDEDDLDLWAEGKLKRDTLDALPPRSKEQTKAMIEGHAERLGIRVEYIRTGRNPHASELAGPHMTEQEHPWRVASERALSSLLDGRWDDFVPQAMEIDRVSVGAGSQLTPYQFMGLAPLAALRKHAQQLRAGRRENQQLEAQTRSLADRVLTELHRSDIDRKFSDDQGILLKEIMRELAQCGFEVVGRAEALQ